MHLYQRLLFGLMAPPWLSPMRPMSSLGSTSVPASNPRVRLSIRHIQRRGAISHFINAAGWWPLSLSHTHTHSLPPSDLVSISHATVAATFSPFRDDDEGDGGEGGARKRQWVKKKSEKRRRRRDRSKTQWDYYHLIPRARRCGGRSRADRVASALRTRSRGLIVPATMAKLFRC